MKNCEIVVGRPPFRIPIHGAPRLRGWALKLVAGIEDDEIKPGFWMSKWYSADSEVVFAFERELHMVFNEESDARKVADFLKGQAEIETEIVKI